MSMYKNLTTVAAVAALAFGLAACGGGGSDSPTTDSGGGDDGPTLTLASLQMGADVMPGTYSVTGTEADLAALLTALGGVDVPAGGYAAGAEITVGGYMLKCSDNSATNCNLSIDEDAGTVTVMGRILVVAEGGTYPDDRTDAQKMADAGKAKAAANKVANTKKTAIAAEADATTGQVRPFDGTDAAADADPSATENYRLTVKHTGSAVEVTVVDGALPADNDPMYEQAATFGNGQMLVRNIGTDRKIIVLHSDIEAPDQKAFSSVHSLTVDRDTDTTADDTYAVLAADNGKIASSSFPSGASTTKTYVVYNADTAAGRASQFSGTFDSASGMYRCVGTGGCTVSTDAMGKFNALNADEWEFTPAAGATVPVADDDYLTYGFWLDTTTKDGKITSYDTVQTFATSSLDASTGLSSVTGTAKYEGDAAGVYVHETKKEDGTLDTATSGRFTADVALSAYFTGNPLRTDGTIEGTVSNFDLDGGQANNWNVKLSATGITTDAGFTGDASGMTGDTGSLSGRFHGAGDAAADAPPVLVGEFNANFVNGAVAGAYGTRKQP